MVHGDAGSTPGLNRLRILCPGRPRRPSRVARIEPSLVPLCSCIRAIASCNFRRDWSALVLSRNEECDVNILLLNAGSSSLKGTLVEPVSRHEIAHGLVDW